MNTAAKIGIIAALAVSALIIVWALFAMVTPVLQPQIVSTHIQPPGLPSQLIIPSISVDAPIINVALAADGTVGVPEGPSQVAWYQLGPRPGSQGSAVITGHFGLWKDGSHSVFDNLNKLKAGDMVQVKDDAGTVLTFKVRETKLYNAKDSAPEVFNNTNGKHLNLITCQGDWLAGEQTYNQRLVIFCDLVE